MLAVRVILTASNEDITRTELNLAMSKVDAIHSKIRAELILDPEAPFKKVFEHEPTRICYGEVNTAYSEGELWPSSCGSFWGYQQPGNNITEVVKITPPSPKNPNMVVKIISKVGATAAGLVAEYPIGEQAAPVIYSAKSFNIEELGESSIVKGVIYSNKEITYSTAIDSSKLVLAAEEGITNEGAVPNTLANKIDDRRVLTKEPTESQSSIRLLYRNPIPVDSLRASARVIERRSCYGSNPVNVSIESVSRSTSLCIQENAVLRKNDNTTTTVPSAKAYLLIPNGTQTDHPSLDIYVRTTNFNHPDCNNCDLIAESNSSISSAAHPGVLTSWSKLATTYLPANGYVVTDKDTYIGLCGTSFTNEQSCQSFNNSSPGVMITDPFTILAGTIDKPKDVYLSGPINSIDTDKRLGVLATRKVYIPYWSTPRNKTLNLSVDIAVTNSANQSAIESYPRQASSQPGNQSESVVFKGKLQAEKIDVTISSNIFQSYLWDLSTTLNKTLLPSPTSTWSTPVVRRMSAQELAENM